MLNKKSDRIFLCLSLVLLVPACNIGGGESPPLESTYTPNPTYTLLYTYTPYPTNTPKPERDENISDEVWREEAQKLAENLRPTVVLIQLLGFDPAINDYDLIGEGSGFLISEDGYIVTAGHKIKDIEAFEVFLFDGRSFSASMIASDSDIDVTLLKIDEDVTGLPFVEFTDSEDLHSGDRLMSIGHPQTLRWVAVVGEFLRLETTDWGQRELVSRVPVLEGIRGAPLFNMSGEVVGIVSGFSPDFTNDIFSPISFTVWDDLCYSYQPVESKAVPSSEALPFILLHIGL